MNQIFILRNQSDEYLYKKLRYSFHENYGPFDFNQIRIFRRKGDAVQVRNYHKEKNLEIIMLTLDIVSLEVIK